MPLSDSESAQRACGRSADVARRGCGERRGRRGRSSDPPVPGGVFYLNPTMSIIEEHSHQNMRWS